MADVEEFETITGQIIRKDDIRDAKINNYKDMFEEGKSPITDFEEGRIARIIVDGDVPDSFELRYLIDAMGRMNFPQHAVRAFLDNCGERFNCIRKPALNSKGEMKYFLPDGAKDYDILIPMGSIVSTEDEEGYEVETIVEATLPAGETEIFIQAESLDEGSENNIEAGRLNVMDVEIDDLQVTNPEAFTGGEDGEEDEPYRERILKSGEGIFKGSDDWFKSMAENFSGVHDAAVFLKDEGFYNIDIVINTLEKPTSDILIDEMMGFFYSEDNKVINLNPFVRGAEIVPVDISLVVSVDSNFDSTTVLNNLRSDILKFNIGGNSSKGAILVGSNIHESLVRVQLYSIISNVEGIINYELIDPVDDIEVDVDEVIVFRDINITEE